MPPAVTKHANPLDILLAPPATSLAHSSCEALRATWLGAREALEVARSPVRAFAELALGEILMESGRIPTDMAGDRERSAFQIHNQVLTAAAFFHMALAEREVGIGSYRLRALQSLDLLLNTPSSLLSTTPRRWKDFDGSYRLLGKAILENQLAILQTNEDHPDERRLADETLQRYAARLETAAPFGRAMRGTTLLRSLLWPQNSPERMYSAALARVATLPYKIHNLGALLRSHFSATKWEWAPGAAPLVVAAAFSEVLSKGDRIIATTVKIPGPKKNSPLGDIDLMVSIAKRSKSGLPAGIHVMEVKYQNCFKAMMGRSYLPLSSALPQVRTSEAALTTITSTVHKGVVLFDSILNTTPPIKVDGDLVGAKLYRAHPINAKGRLTLSQDLLDLVFAPETPFDQILQSLDT